MKYSTKLSDAVHILAFIILHPNEPLTSDRIAESIRTNPGYVRQLMSAMRKHGLLASVKGHPRPSLTKGPSAISLLDVYRSVEGEKPLLHLDTHTNPECGIGVNIQLSLFDYFQQVQSCAEREMQAITLQDILDRYEEKIACPEVSGAADGSH
jgi:Rrf2 family protein